MNRFDQESMDRSKDLDHPCMTMFDCVLIYMTMYDYA